MTHIVHISGGVASWYAGKRVVAKFETENVIGLFADTLIEEKSTYTFLDQAESDLGIPIIRLKEGRTPWQVFHDVKFLGNSRVDPCSKILKRDLLDKWVKERYTPESCIQYFGFDPTERRRFSKVQNRYDPWPVCAPLMEPPYVPKAHILSEAEDAGLTIPILYDLGFKHNNCNGMCVKAGQAHYARLLVKLPEVYKQVEAEEESLRSELGNVSILKDRRFGYASPLPLSRFRERLQRCSTDYDSGDLGSCSCFVEDGGDDD